MQPYTESRFASETIITAAEGGIGYWAEITDYPLDSDYNVSEFSLRVRDSGDEHTVTSGKIVEAAHAWAKWATNKNHNPYYTKQGGIILGRDYAAADVDGEIADMIVQFAIFDEIVYG